MKKKLLLVCISALLGSAVYAEENTGLAQLALLSPAPGTLNYDTYGPFNGIHINFQDKAQVNRAADLFITLKRNDEVVSNVPLSNNRQISYDSVMDYVWQIYFFPTSNYQSIAGGHYELIIPEGAFLVGDAKIPNERIVANYDMIVNDVVIYPAESREMVELSSWDVTFGDAVSLEINPDAEHKPCVIDLLGGSPDLPDDGNDDDNVEYPDESIYLKYSVDGNTLHLELDKPIIAGGTYHVSISDGFVSLIDKNGNKTSSGDLTWIYSIPKVGAGAPDIFPEAGSIIEFPGVIELTLQPGDNIFTLNDMGKNALYSLNEDGTLGDVVADYRAASKNSHFYKDAAGNTIEQNKNKVFLVNVNGEDVWSYPVPGMYQLVTTNGLYSSIKDGKYQTVSSFKYNYQVIDAGDYPMEFSPSTEIPQESIKDITVTFPNAYEDEIKVNVAEATFRSSTTNYIFYPAQPVGNSVTFSTSVPVTMPGQYRLLSAIKTIEINGDLVGVLADYTINDTSEIKQINKPVVLPEHFDIYSAQGIVIRRNATIYDLDALPAGIYIAGGQKIINR